MGRLEENCHGGGIFEKLISVEVAIIRNPRAERSILSF